MSSACFQHEIKTFNYKINNLLKQIKTIFILFNKYLCGPHSHMSSGAGTSYPTGAPEFTPGFSGFRGTRSLVCMCKLYRSMFVLLSFFMWSLLLFFIQQLLLWSTFPHVSVY